MWDADPGWFPTWQNHIVPPLNCACKGTDCRLHAKFEITAHIRSWMIIHIFPWCNLYLIPSPPHAMKLIRKMHHLLKFYHDNTHLRLINVVFNFPSSLQVLSNSDQCSLRSCLMRIPFSPWLADFHVSCGEHLVQIMFFPSWAPISLSADQHSHSWSLHAI